MPPSLPPYTLSAAASFPAPFGILLRPQLQGLAFCRLRCPPYFRPGFSVTAATASTA